MATSSIYKNVSIRNKHLAKGLLRAFETAKKSSHKEHIISLPCEDIKGEDVKKILNDFSK